MKKILIILLLTVLLTGCTDTTSTDEKGQKTRHFKVGETAIVNNTNIKINSIKKVLVECSYEYEGECISETKPERDYFLVVDLTIENTGSEDLVISSLMTFELKGTDGEKGKYAFLTKNITSQLDGSVMPNDILKGQIAYDVKTDTKYYFYYRDSLLDSNIKFVIEPSDIVE